MITIEITQTVYEEIPAGREWQKTGAKRPDGSEVYDYTPEIIKTREVTRTLLRQQLDAIDMKRVIKAINGL